MHTINAPKKHHMQKMNVSYPAKIPAVSRGLQIDV